MNVIEDVHKLVEDAHRTAREKLETRIKALDRQIAPLLDERRAVERALQELTGKKTSSAARRTNSQPRVSKQDRFEQVLDMVRKETDLSTVELGRRLGISSNRATALVKELRDAGELSPGQPLRVLEPVPDGQPA
jgi:polyhydroxyalkanoate synthesis regulator phasin